MRRLCIHGHYRIVEGRITLLLSEIDTPLIVRPVLAAVPAAAGEIETAAERQLAVDDHDLLVLGGTDGIVIVIAHTHPPSRPPAKSIDG